MKTFIPYKLKSNPDRVLLIPEEYARKARDLVDIAMNVRNVDELAKVISQNSYFKNRGYIPLILDFLHLQEKEDEGVYLKAIGEDRIYFNTCLNMAYDEMIVNEGEKKKDALNNIEFFKRIMKSI
jgi:hypothetical protein